MGIELDKALNAHNDKMREGQGSSCMACVHDATKKNRREEWEITKEGSQES